MGSVKFNDNEDSHTDNNANHFTTLNENNFEVTTENNKIEIPVIISLLIGSESQSATIAVIQNKKRSYTKRNDERLVDVITRKLSKPSSGPVNLAGAFSVSCSVELKKAGGTDSLNLPNSCRGRLLRFMNRCSVEVEWSLPNDVICRNVVNIAGVYFVEEVTDDKSI